MCDCAPSGLAVTTSQSLRVRLLEVPNQSLVLDFVMQAIVKFLRRAIQLAFGPKAALLDVLSNDVELPQQIPADR
jgi:hypothetical protein